MGSDIDSGIATVAKPQRFHHLDALRAFAMLLGIGLHGWMSFADFPVMVWPAQDLQQHHGYRIATEAIHGFRMALFFLISGFFTAMMWRRHGLRVLLKHRGKRIGLPLLLGMFTVIPVVFAIIVGSIVLGLSGTRTSKAAQSGDLRFLTDYAAAGRNLEKTLALDLFGGPGLAPLHVAILHDQSDAIDLLLDLGADPDVRQAGIDQPGARPLHLAVAKGDVALTRQLLQAGADVNTRTSTGFTALDIAQTDATTALGTGLVSNTGVDHAQQTDLVDLLVQRQAQSGKDLGDLPVVHARDKSEDEIFMDGIKGLPEWAQLCVGICAFPIFVHLWFLWYLLWLVVAFAIAVKLTRRFKWRLPSHYFSSPRCWFWLIPLTLVPNLLMIQSFGPDTAAGIVPWPPILLYYAVFFGFGALAYGRPEFEQETGKRWPILLTVSLCLLLIGLYAKDARIENFYLWNPVLNLCAACYAWTMSFAMIGIFRRFFNSENLKIRYLSDASYWLYIMHIPLVQVLQIWITGWPLPSLVKFAIVCSVTMLLLLLSYHYLVRYSWIGTLLNGKRSKGVQAGM